MVAIGRFSIHFYAQCIKITRKTLYWPDSNGPGVRRKTNGIAVSRREIIILIYFFDMMKTPLKNFLIPLFFLLIFLSCGKGYEVRVTNRYIEDMDSVIIGEKIFYENVKRQETTEYQKLIKGTFYVTFVCKSKKRINSSITIPNKKSGKRTIQIDGLGLITVLQD